MIKTEKCNYYITKTQSAITNHCFHCKKVKGQRKSSNVKKMTQTVDGQLVPQIYFLYFQPWLALSY